MEGITWQKSALPAQENEQAVRHSADGLSYSMADSFRYGLTLMRSLIMSKVSFGTTFLATNSPFRR